MGAHAGRAATGRCQPRGRNQRDRQQEQEPARASGHTRARASSQSVRAFHHLYTIVVHPPPGAGTRPTTLFLAMSPFWIWTQIAIVVFVVIGMVVAITKLA
jgi:hypothetical protein